jgi:acetyl-CoA decarbonylase/synthase complex subunit gamma
LPRPVEPSLFEINDPGPEAPVLVTGNSEFTLAVVTGLLALTVSPFYLLLVDTRGDTVDMAMIYRSFTPQRLDQGLETHRLAEKVRHRRLIIPGVVAPLREELATYTGWDIRVGPICVAELPLFLGDVAWQPPAGS